jgi:hypothetical protein
MRHRRTRSRRSLRGRTRKQRGGNPIPKSLLNSSRFLRSLPTSNAPTANNLATSLQIPGIDSVKMQTYIQLLVFMISEESLGGGPWSLSLPGRSVEIPWGPAPLGNIFPIAQIVSDEEWKNIGILSDYLLIDDVLYIWCVETAWRVMKGAPKEGFFDDKERTTNRTFGSFWDYVKKNHVFDKVSFLRTALNYVAEESTLFVFRQLLRAGALWDDHTLIHASRGGKLDILKFLRDQGGRIVEYKGNEQICIAAAENGQLEVLQWLRSQVPPFSWGAKTCATAAREGHIEVLQWLRAQDPPCPWDEWTCILAASYGHGNVVEWAIENGCKRSIDVCNAAARSGNLDMLKFLRTKHMCMFAHSIVNNAARSGHLHVLEWAKDNDYEFDNEVCIDAVKGGHLEVLQWLRSQEPPCRWGKQTCATAAEYGRFDILKWAIEHGCPYNKKELLKNTRSSEILTYLESVPEYKKSG